MRLSRIPFVLMTAGSMCLAATSVAHATPQVVVLDEGSFTLYRDGDRIGREDFSIRSAPGGPSGRVLVAQATVATGTRRVTPGINADSLGYPTRYQREVRDTIGVIETYSGQANAGRFASRLLRDEGESAREFRLPPGTVAADDDIVHQLWFVIRRGAGAVVPVLAPRRNVVDSVRVVLVGSETVSIDLRRFDTTHLRLETIGRPVTRDVWVASDGKIIRAAIPSLGIVALRD